MKTNKEKAKELANEYSTWVSECKTLEDYYSTSYMYIVSKLEKMAEWKDEHIKQTLVDFMQYLNKRDFFHDDLCFDIEHQVETFIELRNRNKTK